MYNYLTVYLISIVLVLAHSVMNTVISTHARHPHVSQYLYYAHARSELSLSENLACFYCGGPTKTWVHQRQDSEAATQVSTEAVQRPHFHSRVKADKGDAVSEQGPQPVTRAYPLNSRHPTARTIMRIAEVLGLPTSGLLSNTRQGS